MSWLFFTIRALRYKGQIWGNETATEAGNANQRTLYERLGGEAYGIGLVVERFYRRVQTDAELEPYFGGIDIVKLIEHQRIFISFATGGPDYYAARSLTQYQRTSSSPPNTSTTHWDI